MSRTSDQSIKKLYCLADKLQPIQYIKTTIQKTIEYMHGIYESKNDSMAYITIISVGVIKHNT